MGFITPRINAQTSLSPTDKAILELKKAIENIAYEAVDAYIDKSSLIPPLILNSLDPAFQEIIDNIRFEAKKHARQIGDELFIKACEGAIACIKKLPPDLAVIQTQIPSIITNQTSQASQHARVLGERMARISMAYAVKKIMYEQLADLEVLPNSFQEMITNNRQEIIDMQNTITLEINALSFGDRLAGGLLGFVPQAKRVRDRHLATLLIYIATIENSLNDFEKNTNVLKTRLFDNNISPSDLNNHLRAAHISINTIIEQLNNSIAILSNKDIQAVVRRHNAKHPDAIINLNIRIESLKKTLAIIHKKTQYLSWLKDTDNILRVMVDTALQSSVTLQKSIQEQFPLVEFPTAVIDDITPVPPSIPNTPPKSKPLYYYVLPDKGASINLSDPNTLWHKMNEAQKKGLLQFMPVIIRQDAQGNKYLITFDERGKTQRLNVDNVEYGESILKIKLKDNKSYLLDLTVDVNPFISNESAHKWLNELLKLSTRVDPSAEPPRPAPQQPQPNPPRIAQPPTFVPHNPPRISMPREALPNY